MKVVVSFEIDETHVVLRGGPTRFQDSVQTPMLLSPRHALFFWKKEGQWISGVTAARAEEDGRDLSCIIIEERGVPF